MKQTIKDIVFDYIDRKDGEVNFDELTNTILTTFPNSEWKKTHWAWYKTQIVSSKGKYFNLFSESIKTKLSNGKQSNPKNSVIKNRNEKNTIYKFPNKAENIERDIALALGKVCHHIHPKIVQRIIDENIKVKPEFQKFLGNSNSDIFLYNGSDCVFPGVRRHINSEKQGTWKNNINPNDNTILNDNTFPRHIWAFLTMNKPYEGNMWKISGLSDFELAHIFGHKVDEKQLEKEVFKYYDESKLPYSYFTSASNVVLIPNGLMKPTDKFKSIKIVFYKRHIDLYGNNLNAESQFDNRFVPSWYDEIKWNEPVLPDNWEIKVENLLKYRKKVLTEKYKNASS